MPIFELTLPFHVSLSLLSFKLRPRLLDLGGDRSVYMFFVAKRVLLLHFPLPSLPPGSPNVFSFSSYFRWVEPPLLAPKNDVLGGTMDE